MYLSVYLVFNPPHWLLHLPGLLPPNWILFSCEEKEYHDIHRKMCGIRDHYVKWNIVDRERQTPHVFPLIWNHYFSLCRTDFQKCHHKIWHSSFIHSQIKWTVNIHIMPFIKIVYATSDFYCYDKIIETNKMMKDLFQPYL